MKIPKDIYRAVFRLYASQQWLAEREQPLLEMLDLCDSVEEQTLLTELLNRFVYVNSKQLGDHLVGLADLICNQWGLDNTKTQLVATTSDYNPDSAQFILQLLKRLLPARGWAKVKQNNSFPRSFKDIASFPTVVLVDEFSGTGKTLLSRIRNLKKEAATRERSLGKDVDLKIYVAVIAAIEDVRPIVSAECTKFESRIWLKKGISAHFKGADLTAAIRDMLRLESTLKQDYPGYIFPSFGHGKAEALYSLENANTPNSVFPIFWWRYLSNGMQREPLLDRQDPNLP